LASAQVWPRTVTVSGADDVRAEQRTYPDEASLRWPAQLKYRHLVRPIVLAISWPPNRCGSRRQTPERTGATTMPDDDPAATLERPLGQMSTRQMKKWVWANPERAHQLAQRLNPPSPPDLGGDASGPAEGASHRGCGHGGGGSWKQSGRGTAVAKHDVGLAAVVTPGYLGGADLEPPGDTSECRAVEGDNSTHFIMATNPSRAAGIGQRVALGELVDQLGSASPASPPASMSSGRICRQLAGKLPGLRSRTTKSSESLPANWKLKWRSPMSGMDKLGPEGGGVRLHHSSGGPASGGVTGLKPYAARYIWWCRF